MGANGSKLDTIVGGNVGGGNMLAVTAGTVPSQSLGVPQSAKVELN